MEQNMEQNNIPHIDNTRLMVDGHVHLYDCYNLETFFNNALENLDRYHGQLDPQGVPFERILLLTEGKKNDFFTRFKQEGAFPNSAGYRFMETKEDMSLVLARDNKPLCFLLKGRQIVTRENLEVLLIASGREIEDGLPMDTVLQRIMDNNDMAVLAWGFGKWFFNRGKIIQQVIQKYRSPGFFVGDNSGRPVFWPVPPQFSRARTLNIPILNGSDPLPFPGEEDKPGSYGFSVTGPFDGDEPAGSLWKILLSPETVIESFGRRDSAAAFLKRQIKIRLRK
jgi:hypothetical protein